MLLSSEECGTTDYCNCRRLDYCLTWHNILRFDDRSRVSRTHGSAWVIGEGDQHMFCLGSANIIPTQGYRQSGRRAAASALTIGGAAIALLAGVSNFTNAAENSPRMAQVEHACAVVMGLHKPGDLYDTCIRSLDKTLSELDRARLASTDRGACAQEGLKPGTPAFAACVINTSQSPDESGHHAATAPIR
jgi:hypothetical protein